MGQREKREAELFSWGWVGFQCRNWSIYFCNWLVGLTLESFLSLWISGIGLKHHLMSQWSSTCIFWKQCRIKWSGGYRTIPRGQFFFFSNAAVLKRLCHPCLLCLFFSFFWLFVYFLQGNLWSREHAVSLFELGLFSWDCSLSKGRRYSFPRSDCTRRSGQHIPQNLFIYA